MERARAALTRAALTRRRADAANAAANAADHATDVLQPVITVARGLRRQTTWLRAWWTRTPAERRTPMIFLGLAAVAALTLMPHGPLIALVGAMGAAAWAGRERAPRHSGPSEAALTRLRSLYEALVPAFGDPNDPQPLYTRDGTWHNVLTDHAFDAEDRLVHLKLRYPAYFPDHDPAARSRVEQLLHAKTGRGREYRFVWNEEDNHLLLTALPPLPTDIPAQRFVTGPGETVLGFTDAESTRRTTPVVTDSGATRQAPPLIWRTGPRSTEPHLLALGHPGCGATTLLRSLALQALHHGDVVVIDGSGSGEYACLSGRPGVLAVESGLTGAVAVLEWAAHETERRLIAVNRARQDGHPVPGDARRPLWIIADRPTALSQLAAPEGRTDPQTLLTTPLRHGRAACVTVAVADTLESAADLAPAVTLNTRARAALGALTAQEAAEILGAPAPSTPTPDTPPGRGYARFGAGRPLRLQVPHTPDPHDEETSDARRRAVLDLLPGAAPPTRTAPVARPPGGPFTGATPAHGPVPTAQATNTSPSTSAAPPA
ncbi:hypothetical protein [Wenjunlia tyrosinilytica]|uniref:hypothetical protein n=1 Tax=Wenjunlia tyrosinilytica TaxID=1544741 RepID=UPI00357114EF